MANNFDASPIIVDSAMAGSFRNFLGPKYFPSSTGGNSVASFGRFKIVRVIWQGAARAAADTFVIKDGDPAGTPFATNPANVICTDTLLATPTGPTVYELGMEVMDFMVSTPPTHGQLLIVIAPVD